MPGSFCTVCRARIARGSRCTKHRLQSPSSRNAHTARWVKEFRPQALKRAGWKCQHCGARSGLDVHHADLDPTNNDPKNHIVLCRSCHTEVHRQRSARVPV